MKIGTAGSPVGPVIDEPSTSVWEKLRKSLRRQTNTSVVPVASPHADEDVRTPIKTISALRRRSVVAIQLKYVTFRDAFGVLGVPMIAVAVLCVSWTIWLIVLTLSPNKTANYLMDTSEFDDGQFWLIPEELNALEIVSVTGLVMVGVLYISVLLKMLVWREFHQVEGTILDRILSRCAPSRMQPSDFRHRIYMFIWDFYVFLKELTGFHGKHRKLWNLCLKVLDLVMQSLMLREFLEAGTPIHLTFAFAVFTAVNSLFCAVEIISHRFTAFAEIIIDSLFDLCAAVLFPVVVLAYSVEGFDFDRTVYQTNMEVLPAGSFERRARMFASPSEIELFRVSFDSLRIRTLSDLFLRIGMNIGFAYRFKRVVEVLIQIQSQRQQGNGKGTLGQQNSTLLQFPKVANRSRSCQQAVPKSAAILFILYSIGVVVFTQKAIATSQKVCSSHPECVVFAYRWPSTNFCPCRALIDGDRAPKTFYEWNHPMDATTTVKALATSGTLETIQLINRRLTVLPNELQACRNLNFISLINCEIEELPTWTKKFRKLQYLQIEGKVGSSNLGNLADDLFYDMPELRYLQLGLHQRMTRLPLLNGVPNLSCIILARMSGFVGLPSFDHLPRLQRLEFSVMHQLSWIPDLQSIGKVVHFAVYQGAYLCCNGFLGTCDLNNPFCSKTSCLDNSSLLATPATLQVFEEFPENVCQAYSGISQTPTAETIEMCNGVPFRQCRLPGLEGEWIEGICYNHRMQVLACNPDPAKIKLRRLQITKGVGEKCDLHEEAWLGCKQTTG